jgi:hypothetical protein
MSPRLLRPRASGGISSPLTIPDLALWFDATDPSSYTESSGQVSEFSSKGGVSGSLVQNTANNRPTLFTSSGNVQTATPATINGKQAFFYDGVNDRLNTASNLGILNTLQDIAGASMFAVWQPTSFPSSSWGTIYSVMRGPNAIRWDHALLANGGLQQRVRDSVGNENTSSSPLFSLGASYATAAVVSYQNGTVTLLTPSGVIGTGSTSTSGVNSENAADFAHSIGAFNGSTLFFHGLIGEVLMYRRALPAPETQAVFGYLRRKWGV